MNMHNHKKHLHKAIMLFFFLRNKKDVPLLSTSLLIIPPECLRQITYHSIQNMGSSIHTGRVISLISYEIVYIIILY